MNRPGTTLIEAIIYLAVSMLIISGINQLMVNIYTSLITHSQRSDTLITLACALHNITHDITQAADEGFTVRVCTPDRCIFSLDGSDCGWLITKGGLMRYRGHYDTRSGTWRKRSISMIAGKGTHLVCRYIPNLIGIECTVRKGSCSITQFISTHRRCYE